MMAISSFITRRFRSIDVMDWGGGVGTGELTEEDRVKYIGQR